MTKTLLRFIVFSGFLHSIIYTPSFASDTSFGEEEIVDVTPLQNTVKPTYTISIQDEIASWIKEGRVSEFLGRRLLRDIEDRPPPRILCCDGGGIRGLISALILQKLEELTGKLSWELFDMSIGTSTGAIIVGMVAAKIPATEIVKMYMDKGSVIFGTKLWFRFWGYNGPQYDSQPFKDLIHKTVGDMSLKDCAIPTFITSYNCGEKPGPILRGSTDENEKDMMMYEVIMESSAAPTIFAPSINKRDKESSKLGLDSSLSLEGEKKIESTPDPLKTVMAGLQDQQIIISGPKEAPKIEILSDNLMQEESPFQDVTMQQLDETEKLFKDQIIQNMENSPLLTTELKATIELEKLKENISQSSRWRIADLMWSSKMADSKTNLQTPLAVLEETKDLNEETSLFLSPETEETIFETLTPTMEILLENNDGGVPLEPGTVALSPQDLDESANPLTPLLPHNQANSNDVSSGLKVGAEQEKTIPIISPSSSWSFYRWWGAPKGEEVKITPQTPLQTSIVVLAPIKEQGETSPPSGGSLSNSVQETETLPVMLQQAIPLLEDEGDKKETIVLTSDIKDVSKDKSLDLSVPYSLPDLKLSENLFHHVDESICVDGGLFANNPSIISLQPAKSLFQAELCDCILVSLGTGLCLTPLTEKMAINMGALGWAELMVYAFLNGQVQHFLAHNYFKQSLDKKGEYYRFQIPIGEKNDAIDNTTPENLKILSDITEKYIEKNIDQMKELCEKLMRGKKLGREDLRTY